MNVCERVYVYRVFGGASQLACELRGIFNQKVDYMCVCMYMFEGRLPAAAVETQEATRLEKFQAD